MAWTCISWARFINDCCCDGACAGAARLVVLACVGVPSEKLWHPSSLHLSLSECCGRGAVDGAAGVDAGGEDEAGLAGSTRGPLAPGDDIVPAGTSSPEGRKEMPLPSSSSSFVSSSLARTLYEVEIADSDIRDQRMK